MRRPRAIPAARLAALLALLPALLGLPALLAGCGGDSPAPVEGPPAERHGTRPAERLLTVERIRASLAAASELYEQGARDDAAFHLRAARNLWSEVAGVVRAGDRVLEREVSAAFAAIEGEVGRARSFDAVRDRLAPLGSQLLDGVAEELVPKDARLDSGLKAAVLQELTLLLEARYSAGLSPGEASRQALQEGYGLVVRSQAVARDIAADLGPQRDAVIEGLKDLRERAYPDGAALPPSQAPLTELARTAETVRAALVKRFKLG